jgi:ketosteroid isomerase-like protein
MFDAFQDPIVFETRDLSIAVGADVAFGHSLVRTSGSMKSGQEIDRWLRRTVGSRKITGKWLIEHEHVSLPVNLESGSAVLDLQP